MLDTNDINVDLRLPVHITSAYQDNANGFLYKYPTTQDRINETVDYAQQTGEKILVVHSNNTTETATMEISDKRSAVFALNGITTPSALSYMKSFQPLTICELYRTMMENFSRTGIYKASRHGDRNLTAACITKRIMMFSHMRQYQLLAVDMWMLFNQTYPDSKVILADLENYKVDDRIDQSFCFYKLS